ncbi:putative glutathione peroxidase 5 [Curcuma longa]|uniref:putative glutathione peroxidase 5 n=1 Tax=Curcuma longa TaxID=136217 RepID=UPI003D9E26AB
MGAARSALNGSSIHEFTVKLLLFFVQDGNGNDADLGIYKGKVLLVVNVASKCNYTQLTEVYNRCKGRDFEILAFPCNQFLGQEPWDDQKIKEFACTRFKADYPIFQKCCENRIKWNFTKFLVDKDGKVFDRYGTSTSSMSIEKDIEKALGSQHNE